MTVDELIKLLEEAKRQAGNGRAKVTLYDEDKLEEYNINAVFGVPANEEEFTSEYVDIRFDSVEDKID